MRARGVEGDAVDIVAAIGGQGHAAARLRVGGAGLGELAGDAAHLHHRHAGGKGQDDRHLQQHAEGVADIVGMEFGEAFGAVAALQQESLAFGHLRASAAIRFRASPAKTSGGWVFSRVSHGRRAPPGPDSPEPDGWAFPASFTGSRAGPPGSPVYALGIYEMGQAFASAGRASGERRKSVTIPREDRGQRG